MHISSRIQWVAMAPTTIPLSTVAAFYPAFKIHFGTPKLINYQTRLSF